MDSIVILQFFLDTVHGTGRARDAIWNFLDQAEAAGMSHSVSKMQPLGSSPALPSHNDPTESLWRLDSGTLGC
jgi:hypothetical protein